MTRRGGSLSARLTGWLAFQTFAVLSVVCAAIYIAANVNLQMRQDALLEQRVEVIRHLVEENVGGGDLALMRHKLDDFFRGNNELRLTIRIEDRDETFGLLHPGANDVRDITFTLPPFRPGDPSLEGVLELDITSDLAMRKTLAWSLFLIVLTGAFVMSLLGAWLVRRALAPIKALSAQTASLSPDRMGERLDEDQPIELFPLVRQFNGVLGRLQDAYVQMEGFNADVAHELRTPLATLIGQTELTLTQGFSATSIRDTLGSNLEELHRLSQIVQDMLFVSRAARGERVVRRPVPSLHQLAIKIAQYHELEADDAGVRIGVYGDASSGVDEGLIQRAMSNLVSNAIRFATPGSEVAISIHKSSDLVYVDVKNQGLQIPADYLPKLFERFFRADPACSVYAEHHGLGLAIVAAIARMHGGNVHANSSGGETCIGLRFPLSY